MSGREAAGAAALSPVAAGVIAGESLQLSVEGDASVACGWLDPAEPFLADHQPGGCPLLGTVGGLEILAAWMAGEAGAPQIVALEAVEAIRPIVFETGTPKQLKARWHYDSAAASARRIIAELSTDGSGGETVHVRCAFVFGRTVRAELRADLAGCDLSCSDGVEADEIYRVFFHGPAFRVVARARRRGTIMVSELASPLPRWSAAAGPTFTAPRLIELGLQTAGLLQLALDGTMMIPRQIDRIDRYRSTDVDCARPMFAVAERIGSGPGDPIDVRIVDTSGAVHLGISGYRCVPLPFATDDSRLAELANHLLNSGSGPDT